MIQVTRLNHVPLVLNSDLIEFVEVTPDTVITLTTREKIRVRESAEEVISKVVEFRRSVLSGMPACPLRAGSVVPLRADAEEDDDG